MSLTPLVTGSTLAAREPLLVRIAVSNRTDAPVVVVTGNGHGSAFRLSVCKGEGGPVATSPALGPWGGFGGVDVPPRSDRSWVWVVTGLYQFTEPGGYTLRLQLEQPLPAGRQDAPVIAEATAKVYVRPFDAKRVDARCEELIRPLWEHSALGELDVGCRTKAVYSVRHDVALPYMEWAAREWNDPYACRAIRRVGTPRAKALFEALASRTDRVGQAARDVPKLNMPDFTMWDVVCD